jgi:DNA polymerase sigma
MEKQQDFIPFDFAEEFFEEETKEQHKESVKGIPEKSKNPSFQSETLLLDLPTPPWVPPERRYPKDLLDMLHEEIDDYVDYISPTHSEHSLRELTIKRFEVIVQSIWPDAVVFPFGSFETHLYLPSSDVDLVVFDSSLKTPSCLFQLRAALNASQCYADIEVIDKARVTHVFFLNMTSLMIDSYY